MTTTNVNAIVTEGYIDITNSSDTSISAIEALLTPLSLGDILIVTANVPTSGVTIDYDTFITLAPGYTEGGPSIIVPTLFGGQGTTDNTSGIVGIFTVTKQ